MLEVPTASGARLISVRSAAKHSALQLAASVPEPIREALKAALGDGYTLGRELGAGGMATVYLAHDVKHDRDVAIKVLDPQLVRSLASERFLREIGIAARLSHPHILPLIDSGSGAEGPILYYVMPVVEGESLRDRIQRDGRLSLDEALRLATEIADALACAHEHGVIHRDIKPDNVNRAALQDCGAQRPRAWHGAHACGGGSRELPAPRAHSRADAQREVRQRLSV